MSYVTFHDRVGVLPLATLALVIATGCMNRTSFYGPLDLNGSTVSVSTNQLIADGVSTAQVTVALCDGEGQPIVGVGATLAASGSDAYITQPTALSNARGEVVGWIAAATPGTRVVSAWVTVNAQTAQVPQTAPIRFVQSADGNLSPAVRLVLVGLTSATAGVAQSFTVTALDNKGNVAPTYAGTVAFSSSDPQAVLPSPYTFTPKDAGSHTFAAGVVLKTAGARIVSAQDRESNVAAATNNLMVTPAAVAHVLLANMPQAAVRATLYPVMVTLRDAYGNLATNTADIVHFASSDANAALPADAAFTAADGGTSTFEVGLFTNGTQNIRCTDVATQANTIVANITVSGAQAVAVAAGQGALSTCALFDNHQAKCWGYNPNGNLGYGDVLSRGAAPGQMGSALPYLRMGTGRSVLSISSGGDAFIGAGGGDMACAVLDDHTARCWGYNGYGNLGYGDTRERHAPGTAPIDLGEDRTAQSLAVGGTHVCAVLDNHQVTCWGNNNAGQLGTGTFTGVTTPPGPVPLGDGRMAIKVATGYTFTCALLDNGAVSCWGNNAFGQLGAGNTSNNPRPATVRLPMAAVDLSLGSNHVCTLLSNGQVGCWGYNRDGQLGLGDTNDRSQPAGTMLLNGHRAIGLNTENDSTCVVLDTQEVTCFGFNGQGELGLGDTTNRIAPQTTPVYVGQGRRVLSVTGGTRFTCALLDTAQITCWGDNPDGELGLGDSSGRADVASTTPDQYAPLQLW